MNVQSVKRKTEKDRRVIYLRVHRVVMPETGELVGALIPESAVSQREMRDRALRTGDVIRCELRKQRDYGQWKWAHTLGALLAEQAEGYDGLTQHKALKKLQLDSGTECDVEIEEFDLGELGIAKREKRVARSLSFDQMEQQAFDAAWAQMVRYAASECLHGMDEDQVQEYVESIAGPLR